MEHIDDYLDLVEAVLTPDLGEGTQVLINGVPLKGLTKLHIDAYTSLIVKLELQGALVSVKASPETLDLVFTGTKLTQCPMPPDDTIDDDTIDPGKDQKILDAHCEFGSKILRGTIMSIDEFNAAIECLRGPSTENELLSRCTDTVEFLAGLKQDDGIVRTPDPHYDL